MIAFERQGGKISTTEKHLCTGKVIEVIQVQTEKELRAEEERIDRLDTLVAFSIGLGAVGTLICLWALGIMHL